MIAVGSGNWIRWNKRTTTNSLVSLNIRNLKKRGYLEKSDILNLNWNCAGRHIKRVRITISNDFLQLTYRYTNDNNDWVTKKEWIIFDWTPCNYGGKRQWFLCPICEKRVEVLYGIEFGFLCRHCCKLPYASQSEPYLMRMVRKIRKIRKKLNADIDLGMPIFDKPKGMHWKTFNSLVEKEESINNALFSGINEKLGI